MPPHLLIVAIIIVIKANPADLYFLNALIPLINYPHHPIPFKAFSSLK